MSQAFPPLSQLVDATMIPSGQLVADAIDQALTRLAYRDLVVETSRDNDGKSYRLTLITRELGFDLFGSGLRIIFFPADDDNAISELSLSFEYRWAILKYIPEFETLSFAGTGKAFLDVFLELADVSEAQFLEGIIGAFINDPQPYLALVNLLKGWQGGASPLAALTLTNPPVGYSEIEYILQQVTAISQSVQADIDIFQAAFETAVEDLSDLDGSIDKLVALFQGWFGDITRDDLEALLLPQFSLGLDQVAMAVDIPRSVLVPIDANNDPIDDPPDDPPKSRLNFTAGGLSYDSATGFDISVNDDVAATLTRSMIPGFGLTLDFEDIKIDLSRTSNIAEADADGRPADFMGVFVGKAILGLPAKWFSNYQPPNGPTTTLAVVARDMLIGTGGLSGLIGLEVLAIGAPADGTTELSFVLGQKPSSGARKGFVLGFSRFDMKFRQNVLLESSIKGSLTVPKFQAAPIAIELFLSHDGDFEVTASTPGGHDFTWPDVFTFKAQEVKVGKTGDKVFLELSGVLTFDPTCVLGSLIKKPIALKGFTIHSDGSIELKGGVVPLPESVALHIGPAKIAITALHFGSHKQDFQGLMREYRYFGLDAAISVDPGRCGGRGDGIKFYYTVDNDAGASPPRPKHHFLRIEGLGIDLCIPGSASEEEAALILKGYLALKDPVYEGSISFKLMKGKIVGGAAMKYDTSYPAWLVDVNLNLPKAIPLGSTPLGISSLRGLFGLRYVASKDAIVPPLAIDASWGDYFRAEQDVKGVTYKKFVTPDHTQGSSNPFSVGVGVGLITQADNGKTFSSQLLLMVSLPNLVMLEGRADILGDHAVSIDDDPPYYAYLALSPETIETGAGINYLLPKDGGALLNLNAVMEAAYFFHNASAWYMHLGTKDKPVTARILSMFDGYAYLMLSASGVEMGAGVHFDFAKTYGPVSVSAHAYLDTWAYVAFERFQAGGGIALGGYLDAHLFKFGLHIELAAQLTVEAPKPFLVSGSVHVCVSVNLKIKTFTTCFDVDFKWEKSQAVDRTAVLVMATADNPPCTAQHMVSNTTYPVEYSMSPEPAAAKVIPLDCFIDVKFTKPVDPSGVAAHIGGYTSPPAANIEAMPPKYGSRVVKHAYTLDDVRIDIRGPAGTWLPYHPYRALAQAALLDPATITQMDSLPLGVWQKQDTTYSQIRFLGQTPFSWMDTGDSYCPDETGVTASSSLCVTPSRNKRCLTWPAPQALDANTAYVREGVLYRVTGRRAEAVAFPMAGLAPAALAFSPGDTAQFRFLERAVTVDMTVFSTAPAITVRWQRRKPVPDVRDSQGDLVFGPWTPPDYEDIVAPILVPRSTVVTALRYDDPANPVDRVVVETPAPDWLLINSLVDQITSLRDNWVVADAAGQRTINAAIAALNDRLAKAKAAACTTAGDPAKELTAATAELDAAKQQLADRQKTYTAACGTMSPAKPQPAGMKPTAVKPAVASKSLLSRLTSGLLRSFGFKPKRPLVDCVKLAADIAALQAQIKSTEARIMALRASAAADTKGVPPGWTCGTFVHNVCYLSLDDYEFNQTIPDLAAIAAEQDRLRLATSGVIAPIWQPNQIYRISLTTSDTVTDEQGHVAPRASQTNYVHFRTDGPIGFFDAFQMSDQMTAPADASTTVPDDGRPEIPERALKFYIDDRSTPDARGDLLYAQPTYYRDVVIRLFFSHPHAWHFFAAWPDVGAGARNFALEFLVKDPAEATPTNGPPEPQAAVHIAAPLTGQETWTIDPAPRLTSEIRAVRGFQTLPSNSATEGLACLTPAGPPITPLSKALEVSMGDLLPDKLYTVVVLNRNLDDNGVAEVARYPFRTSLYADFASHINSYKLTDTQGTSALAVFALDHDLAATADEPGLLVSALAMVDQQPGSDTAAYADPFDRLIFAHLRLDSPAPVVTVEFNFVSNRASGHTYALWIRSLEPLIDPRLPPDQLDGAIRLLVSSIEQANIHVLFSKDRCQAFVMTSNTVFPTQDVAIAFTRQTWTGNAYAAQTVTSDPFSKP